MDLIGQRSTDTPLVINTLVNAIAERTTPGGRVIELGFGSGWLLEELRGQLPDASLFALDLSPGNARHAHQQYSDRVRVLIGDMERLPFRGDVFHVIVTCWTLYFMRDIDAALTEVARCLAPGGRIVIGASAASHEIECEELVMQATRIALGTAEPLPDIGRRFDLDSGRSRLRRHFANIELREWQGEMVLSTLDEVAMLWKKWEPVQLEQADQDAVRVEFLRLAGERIAKDGALRIRRRGGAFVVDVP
jgi:ubiquinone/menaquinone biosynthesis C-methylase UbiE